MVNPQWYGIGVDYRGTPDNPNPVVFWRNNIIPRMKALKFNTIRITFGKNSYHSDLDYDVLDQVLSELAANGIKAILCFMNNPFRDELLGYFGSDDWLNTWENIANRFKGDGRLIGLEIWNEQFMRFCDPTRVTNKWQVGRMNAICYDRIRATGDNHTIVFSDPQFWMENELNVDGWKSGETYRDVVIAFHPWAKDQEAVNHHINRMRVWKEKMPIWIGETGIRQDVPTPPDYLLEIINYAVANEIGFSIWFVGYPGGQEGAWNLYIPVLEESDYIPTPKHVLTISSTANGTTDPTPGEYALDEGAITSVSAIPDMGYMLDRWELDGADVRNTSPYDVTMDKDHTLHAVFTKIPPPPPEKHNLTIAVTIGGTTDPEPGTLEYDEGTNVPVLAKPAEGYDFDHSMLDGEPHTENPITVTMDAEHYLLVLFKPTPIPPTRLVEPLLGAGAGLTIGIVTRNPGYAVAGLLLGLSLGRAVTVKLTGEQLNGIPLLYPEAT